MVLSGEPAPADLPLNHDAPAPSQSASSAAGGFADFGLPTAITAAIRALGYEKPTAIQKEAIPALLNGRDVTGVAQTGTGKTAAYGLPLLAAIDPREAKVQALVLVPTRELAIQVADALTSFAAKLPVGIVPIYGGSPIGRQITALKRGAQIVVGTPGRVIDLIERKSLHLEGVTFAVLDEADEMLRMGFAEDVDRILTEVPTERQTALFSATMPKEIRRVAAQHLRTPVDVSVAASATPVANIEQRYIVLPFRDKALALQRIIAVSEAEAAVVFVRTRSACDELGSALIGAGVKAAFISGDVSQNERERTIERLRAGAIDVLVATDVAARGMDVERIGLVVNFDAPADPETYIHRVGRTGRAGRAGSAVTFFTPRETSRLRFIEKTIGRKLVEIDVPSAAQVLDRQAESALAAAVARHAAGRLTNYANALTVAADIAGIPTDELAAALLATIVGDDGSAPVEIERRGNRRDRNDDRANRSDRSDHSDRGQGSRREDGARGHRDDRRPRDDRGAGSRRDDRRADRDRSDRSYGDRPARHDSRDRGSYRGHGSYQGGDSHQGAGSYRGRGSDQGAGSYRGRGSDQGAGSYQRGDSYRGRDERRSDAGDRGGYGRGDSYRGRDGYQSRADSYAADSRGSASRDVADRAHKSKPRWDAARRAERSATGARDALGGRGPFTGHESGRSDRGRPSSSRNSAPRRGVRGTF